MKSLPDINENRMTPLLLVLFAIYMFLIGMVAGLSLAIGA